jgi:biopolymer transport protein ExbB
MSLFHELGGSLLEQYLKGGPVMHLISALSLVSVAAIVYKVTVFRKAETDLGALISSVRKHVMAGEIGKALESCEAHRGPTAVALKVGLLHADDPVDEIERHIEAAAISSISYLQRYLGGLATIVSVAPLIGFFGTVVGMIMSFDVIANEGLDRPELVAEGISVALLTTAYGLLVAFLTQPFYNYFVTRLAEHTNRIDVATHSLMDAMNRRRRLSSATAQQG